MKILTVSIYGDWTGYTFLEMENGEIHATEKGIDNRLRLVFKVRLANQNTSDKAPQAEQR